MEMLNHGNDAMERRSDVACGRYGLGDEREISGDQPAGDTSE